MPASASPEQKLHKLLHLKIGSVSPNPKNPRLEFPQDELQLLSQSIAQKGVLIPVVVRKRGAKEEYELVDGERRFRCALELGLDTIPAVIRETTSPEETLVDMFNIHMVREEWQDMPTAWALEELVKARENRGAGVADSDLEAATGLSADRIKRLRYALELPKAQQQMIRDGKIPLNFFWELKVNVIEPLGKLRPQLAEKLEPKKVQAAFVEKRINDVITDAVSLRKVRLIIGQAAKDAAESETGTTELDATIEELVTDEDLTVEEAYQDSVEAFVELNRLQRKCDNMVKAFDRLMERSKGRDKDNVRGIGKKLIKSLTKAIR